MGSLNFSFLRKLKRCPCPQHLPSPVPYPLCPGPFSMERITRPARHDPKNSRSSLGRALLWREARKCPLGCFPGKPWSCRNTKCARHCWTNPSHPGWSSWAAEHFLLSPRQSQRDNWIMWGDVEQPRIKEAENWIKSILLPFATRCEQYVLHLRNKKFKACKHCSLNSLKDVMKNPI